MSVRLSCPSCNTSFALAALPENKRAACPRCGDLFPIRGAIEEASEQRVPTAPLPVSTQPQRNHVRTIAGVVIFLLLAGGLTYYFTSARTSTQHNDEPRDTTSARPPSELVGLGYLPAECNVAFAIQPGPVLAFAERTQRDPRQVLSQAGLPEPLLAALEQSGVPLPQVDHLAGGIPFGEVGELRAALVLVLKQPLAEEANFLRNLKAKPMPGNGQRHSVELARLPFSLARVSSTVWVFGLHERDFSAVEAGGLGPGGQLRIAAMLAQVPADAAVWLSADDEGDWTQKPLVKLAALSPEARKWLPGSSTFRGGLFAIRFGEAPSMELLLRTADSATAEQARGYFRARAAEVPGAASEPRGETGVYFAAPFDPAASGKLLQRFLDDAK